MLATEDPIQYPHRGMICCDTAVVTIWMVRCTRMVNHISQGLIFAPGVCDFCQHVEYLFSSDGCFRPTHDSAKIFKFSLFIHSYGLLLLIYFAYS